MPVRDGSAKGSRGRRGPRLLAAPAAVLLSCSLVAACSSSGSGGSPAPSSSASGPDVAFFNGKTINYVIPNTPGSPPGLILTAMKPALEKYLGATINIEYNTNVATVGEDIVGSSKPDGLTLGNLTPLVVLNEEYAASGAPDFSLDDVSWVSATKTAPILVGACGGASISSYSSLISKQTKLEIVNIPTGATNEMTRLLMQIFPVPHSYLNGYTAATAITGCQRGDGNFAALGVSKALDAAGTAPVAGVTPLLLSSAMPSNSPNAFLNSKVPTLATLAKQDPPKTALGKEALQIADETFTTNTPYYATFGPPGIPKSRLLALDAAFEAASQTTAAKEAELAAGVYPGYVDSSALTSFFTTALAQKAEVQKLLATN
jgi:tripartite-type tricarboxylate transporter receptor subunit TctC